MMHARYMPVSTVSMHPYFTVALNTDEIDALTEEQKQAFVAEAQAGERKGIGK